MGGAEADDAGVAVADAARLHERLDRRVGDRLRQASDDVGCVVGRHDRADAEPRPHPGRERLRRLFAARGRQRDRDVGGLDVVAQLGEVLRPPAGEGAADELSGRADQPAACAGACALRQAFASQLQLDADRAR